MGDAALGRAPPGNPHRRRAADRAPRAAQGDGDRPHRRRTAVGHGGGTAAGETSCLNFGPGETCSHLAAPLAGGRVQIHDHSSGVHVVAGVEGYCA
ncbi:hypothetical protein ACFQZC_21215 [Streptacidiphilus monticola]